MSKRPSEGGHEEGPPKKTRRRWDDGGDESSSSGAPAKPAPAAGKPALDKKALLEKIAKQKEALLKRKQEQAIKLRTAQHEKDVKQLRRLEADRRKKEAEKLQQIQSKLGTVVPNSASSSAERRTTLAINKRILAEKEREKSLFLDTAPELETDPEKNKLFDPRVEVHNAVRQRRQTFKFVEPGRHTKQAEKIRQKASIAQLEAEFGATKEEDIADAGIMMMIKEKQLRKRKLMYVVDVEWWDTPFVGESYDNVPVENDCEGIEEVTSEDVDMADADASSESSTPSESTSSSTSSTSSPSSSTPSQSSSEPTKEEPIKQNIVTSYVQHPVLLEPPTAEPEGGPVELVMTKKERKKWRRMKRLEEQKEEQTKILLGLKPPPEPRVRIANLYRVRGQEAIQDPTAIEREAREQMAERQANHDERNAARKLTDEQRREKKIAKLQEDTSLKVCVALFYVRDLSDGKNKYKVSINAKQLYLTGAVVIHNQLSVVLVEGGPKGIRKYKKLMLNRIKWNPEDGEEDEDDYEEGGEGKGENKCELVWEGTTLRRHFEEFRDFTHPTIDRARRVFQSKGVGHYWDMAFAQRAANS